MALASVKKKKNTSVVLAKWYTLFCGSSESRELVLGTWVWFLLLFVYFLKINEYIYI